LIGDRKKRVLLRADSDQYERDGRGRRIRLIQRRDGDMRTANNTRACMLPRPIRIKKLAYRFIFNFLESIHPDEISSA